VDLRTELLLKGGLSLVALAAVAWRHLRPGTLAPERAGRGLLLMAVLAALAWCNFGALHGRGAIHHWEQFHYFLGSKYFPELGYDGLYAASLEAERQLRLAPSTQAHVRDLRTNEVVPTGEQMEFAREARARFSGPRWRDFVDDVRYFLVSSRREYLAGIRKDHGYNPTPTWTFTARLLTRWLPASDLTLTLLGGLDVLLVVGAFALVFRTFGSRVGCLSLIVFGLGYPWRYDWIGGCLLRQDWLAAVTAAVCLMRRERFAVAGGLLAYAALARAFPAAFLLGPAVLGLRHALERRPLAWLARLGGGLLAGAVLCLGAGALTGAGWGAWPAFADNLERHRETWLTNNVGLDNVLLYDGATLRREDVDWNLPEPWIHWQERMNRREAALAPWLWAARLLFLALVAAAAWRLRIEEATVLGVAAAFAVAPLTCYYWAMLALVPLGRGRWLPTAGWLAINTALYTLALGTGSFEAIYGLLSWALLVFFVAWMVPDAGANLSRLLRNLRGQAGRTG